MAHKIQIVDLGNGYYSFITDKFSSLNHFILCSSVKSMYKYAWDAYKDAKKMLIKYPYHVNAMKNKKYAIDEYSEMVVTDISADDMLISHYEELYDTFEDRARGLPENDDDESKILYGEIKGVVGEIIKVKEEIKSNSDKSNLESILHKFSKLVKKYFNSFLQKDAKEEDIKGKEQEASQEVSQEGQDQMLGEAGDMGGAPMPSMNPSALNKNTFIKMASRKINISSSEISEILDNYCDKICNSMKIKDSSIIGNVNVSNRFITIKNAKGPLLEVNVNKNLMIDGIYPLGITSQLYPSISLEFYQKYWKPVVEAVGHCYLPHVDGENKYIILSNQNLPDMPNTFPTIKDIKSWNCTKSSDANLSIEFRRDDSGSTTWFITPSQVVKTASSQPSQTLQPSKYTEEDYFRNGTPAMVICTDPKLKSIFQKIGEVSKVFPSENGVIAEINFGNNVVVRLREEKFDMIDVNNPPQIKTEKIQRNKNEL